MSDNHVVIVGGGFAGVALARALERQLPDNIPLVLLSAENFLLFSPLLSEVVGAAILPGQCVVPLRQMLHRTRLLRAEVTSIDRERRELVYQADGEHRLRYGQLVVACGMRANMAMIDGSETHAFALKSLGDALELRNRVLLQLERAEVEADPDRRRKLTSFAVIGGGSSGVEIAGALHDLLASARRLYPDVRADDCRVCVIEASDHLCSELPRELGEFAARHMRRRGIEIRLNASVDRIRADSVVTGDGECIVAGTTVCTIGTRPQPLIERLDMAKHQGRLATTPDLMVRGEQHVWTLGDCASIVNDHDGSPAPPTAQFATREALHLADNINRRIHDRRLRPFSYRARAVLATVGHRRAIGNILGVNIRGWPAWVLWRGVYLAKLPTVLRRLQVLFEWTWQSLFPPDVTYFHYAPYRLAAGQRYREAQSPGDDSGDTTHPPQNATG